MKIPLEIRAINILKKYEGSNNYILKLKNEYRFKSSFIPTPTQSKYILKNYKINPKIVNKTFNIHPYNSKELQKKSGLGFFPKQIYIEKILSRQNEILHIWGCYVEDCCNDYRELIYLDYKAILVEKDIGELDFSIYNRKPLKHQIPAIEALLKNDKFILGDEMGLAKTSSAIVAAMEGKFKKILVVCTATIKLNWKKEISIYDDPNNISIINSSNFNTKKWTIINYDILHNFHSLKDDEIILTDIIDAKFDLVIADECHYLKNYKSNRTKLFIDFTKDIKNIWLMSGTPITNKPIDFYTLLKICDSPITANWQFFVKRYCNAKPFYKKGSSKKMWIPNGASNLDELREYSKYKMLRRLKTEVTDLPPKIIKPVYLPEEICKEYNDYFNEYKDWVDTEADIKLNDHLTKLVKIRQQLSYDKISHTIKIAEDYIEQGHKVIIFSCFKKTIQTIHEHFGKKSVIIDGSVIQKNRDLAVTKFQNNKNIDVFCGNIIAAGAGITLTESDITIFNDIDWVPAYHMQSEDRNHRLGQKNTVYALYMLIDNTLDTMMFDSLHKKIANIKEVMGDNEYIDDDSFVKEVIEKLA